MHPKQGGYLVRVLLHQLDGKIANLALMKIGAFHLALGHQVSLTENRPNIVYVSCVFARNAWKARAVKAMYPEATVLVGGVGVSLSLDLPDIVEHTRPAYELWGVDYSLGYTTRGCIRYCQWCVVPQKEGWIRHHTDIAEFHDPSHSKLVLLDNNFLAGEYWRRHLSYIREQGLKVSFNAGLDARLITEENAQALAELDFYDWKFKMRRLYLSWDTVRVGNSVRRAIRLLEAAGVNPRNQIIVYVLVGFNTTLKQDLYRIEELRRIGANPFVMVYNEHRTGILKHLARWVNRSAAFRSCTFTEYLETRGDRRDIEEIKEHKPEAKT